MYIYIYIYTYIYIYKHRYIFSSSQLADPLQSVAGDLVPDQAFYLKIRLVRHLTWSAMFWLAVYSYPFERGRSKCLYIYVYIHNHLSPYSGCPRRLHPRSAGVTRRCHRAGDGEQVIESLAPGAHGVKVLPERGARNAFKAHNTAFRALCTTIQGSEYRLQHSKYYLHSSKYSPQNVLPDAGYPTPARGPLHRLPGISQPPTRERVLY